MRVALFNDTGKCAHVGCRAVSSGHNRMLARTGLDVTHRFFYGTWRSLDVPAPVAIKKLSRVLSEVDAVIVNGEGTIHHGSGRNLLTILKVAQSMHLPTLLVNAVLQAVKSHHSTLKRLTALTVRDMASSRYLTGLGIKHRVVFDALIEAEFSSEPSIACAGKVLVTDWHGARDHDVGVMLEHCLQVFGDDAVFYPLSDRRRSLRWSHALADVRTARLVVTGRHHGVCLAALAGVPFVACGSNSWKVEGLLDWLPGKLTVCESVESILAACEDALQQPQVFEGIRAWVEGQRPLTSFQALARAA